jgi:hypothetical protein
MSSTLRYAMRSETKASSGNESEPSSDSKMNVKGKRKASKRVEEYQETIVGPFE